MSQRLISLDFFRGFTIAAMIVVNDPGSWAHIFPPLRHADWHGATPTDLVFPFFLFIVGVSIVLSLSKIKNSNHFFVLLRFLPNPKDVRLHHLYDQIKHPPHKSIARQEFHHKSHAIGEV